MKRHEVEKSKSFIYTRDILFILADEANSRFITD